MEYISLNDTQGRADFFQRTVVTNVAYWQKWVVAKTSDIVALDRERNGVLRGISFALNVGQAAWPSACELILDFSLYMERRGHWDIWHQVLSRALKVAQHLEDAAGEVNLLALLARLLFQQGRFKESASHYRQTIRLARRIGDRFNEARACTNLGFYYIEREYWYRAEALCCYALRLFEEIDSNHGQAHTENHLGILYTRQHHCDQAQQHLERACAIWQSMGDEHGLMRGYINLAGLHIRMEQADLALDYLAKALDRTRLTGEEATRANIFLNLGIAHQLRGDLAQAEVYLQQSERIFQKFSNSKELPRVWRYLGITYLHQGKWQKAFFYLENSLIAWRDLGNRIGEAEVLTDMVEYELTQENREETIVRLREVENLVGSNDMDRRFYHLRPRLAKYRAELEASAQS